MKPAAFEYCAPRSLQECVALLHEHGEEARLLAGGQSLMPLMNLRMASPEVIVDLNRVEGLAYVRADGDAIAIGAMTRYADVEASELARERLPLVVRATHDVGYAAVRNRGTAGGAVAHADPVGEWPCLVRTLDAELVSEGPHGRRTIAAADFFQGLFATALAPDEVLVEVRFPSAGAPAPWGFREFARKTGDYAVAAAAVELEVAGATVSTARVGFANLGDRPTRSTAVEGAIAGRPVAAVLDDALQEEIVRALLEARAGQGVPDERLRVAGVMARRALDDALARARGAAA